MLVKCNWKTCKSNKNEMCKADAIELKSFDYEEDDDDILAQGENISSVLDIPINLILMT